MVFNLIKELVKVYLKVKRNFINDSTSVMQQVLEALQVQMCYLMNWNLCIILMVSQIIGFAPPCLEDLFHE